MKAGFLKVLCLIAGAMAMVACGGNNGSGIFGEMPSIYRSKIAEVSAKGKSVYEGINNGSIEDGQAAIKELEEYMKTVKEEIKTELTPHIDAIKGTSIPCEVSDSLPYTLAGNLTITEVTSPYMKLTGLTPLSIHVEGAVVCKDTIYGYTGQEVYMLISSNDGEYVKSMSPYANYSGENHFVIAESSWGGTYEQSCLFPGDTLKLRFKFSDEDMPIDIVNKCEKLHVVTESVYDKENDAINEKEADWTKLFEEELGMDE